FRAVVELSPFPYVRSGGGEAMNWLRSAGQIGLAWVALLAAQVAAGMIAPIRAPAAVNSFVWLLASDFLVVAALSVVAAGRDWRGWRLGLALAALPLGMGLVNLLEGVVFLGHVELSWSQVAANMAATYVLAAPLWGLILGRGAGRAAGSGLPERSLGQNLWRF